MNVITARTEEPKRLFSGSTLKIIALITMLIDHVAATLLARIIILNGYDETLYDCYFVMRKIGRLAFPIFIFLMIEGFDKTRSRVKYVWRMAAFAAISEIPFDLAFSAEMLEFAYQNVFFTLLIGMLTMWMFDYIGKLQINMLLQWALCLGCFVAGMCVAEFMHTDYGARGIICIMAMYVFRRNRMNQIVAGVVAFLWEITAPLAFIPIAFYNGRRGLQLKYIFYVFYPLHLIILYLISMALGMHQCPVV